MSVNYKNKLIIMTFQNGSYSISDINQIIDNTIKRNLIKQKNQLQYQLMLIDMLF